MPENYSVRDGLKHLAFGSCNDAVVLAFAEELPPPEVIEKLDLFNVSEIKRVKGGGVEIKLFDRLKALEKLYEIENSAENNDKAQELINALALSAKGGDDD
ncbi:MAG: terminase small subunit [Ruminococcus flavefaciens]|nr:terminase small subunit [Ruminococcus flavefaciens]MCM1228842.1 terminase small subunit [Ruminococcus flavefaciens]